MEYGLRRYEATQRLLWFLFFLLCLGVATLVTSGDKGSFSGVSAYVAELKPENFKSTAFWAKLHWIGADPFGWYMLFLIWAAVLFLGGRFLWVLVQFAGMFLARNVLKTTIRSSPGRIKPSLESPGLNAERLFPAQILHARVNRLPLQIFFHPFQRLRLMLNNPQGILSTEELVDKERRIVETDWQIQSSSWSPFRWLIWFLPLFALMQALWLFYLELQPAIQGDKELQDILALVLASFFPLAQVLVITIVFNLLGGLLRRVENLYLSNVDALFYDQFVSRVPFQSSDTVILLEALQKHFQELHAVLRRLEHSSVNEKDVAGLKN
jgi:hypothetical protein